MPNYHRYYIPQSLVFITCVTYQRLPLFQKPEMVRVFWEKARAVQEIHPYHLLAYVLLPDHFHWLMLLPENNPNFSRVIASVKRNFTFNLKREKLIEEKRFVWQPRFWDHIIRNEADLQRHMDYIHWNPVKHEYVKDPCQWTETSFHHWVKKGVYPQGWGTLLEPEQIKNLIYE